jgi:hypothetical protein
VDGWRTVVAETRSDEDALVGEIHRDDLQPRVS